MLKLISLKAGDLVLHRNRKHGILISVDAQAIFEGSDCVCRVLYTGGTSPEPVLLSNLKRVNT
jgi:hypothetical protein